MINLSIEDIELIRESLHNLSVCREDHDRADALCEMAKSWQRLQWRPASEAPIGVNLLVWVRKRGVRTISEGHRLECGTWVVCGIHRDIYPDEVLGFIPFDALPALNTEPEAIRAALSRARGEGT